MCTLVVYALSASCQSYYNLVVVASESHVDVVLGLLLVCGRFFSGGADVNTCCLCLAQKKEVIEGTRSN